MTASKGHDELEPLTSTIAPRAQYVHRGGRGHAEWSLGNFGRVPTATDVLTTAFLDVPSLPTGTVRIYMLTSPRIYARRFASLLNEGRLLETILKAERGVASRGCGS
jgi:hypothetical protein